MTALFGDRRRTDPGPARPGEPTAAFLARSANPAFGRVRELLEAWHERVPAEARSGLTRRLGGRDDRDFDSAWAELYTRTVLGHLGFEIEDHPAMLEAPTGRISGSAGPAAPCWSR